MARPRLVGCLGDAMPGDSSATPLSAAEIPAARLFSRAIASLSLKLGVVSTLVVSAVIGAGASYTYAREREGLLESMDQAAATQARLTLTGLQFAMLENNRALLHELLAQYARSPGVARVFIADAGGTVALTSEPSWAGSRISLPGDVCPRCELSPGSPRTRTAMVADGAAEVLRSLTVVSNEPRCHRCHPEVQKTIGVLGVDFSTASLDRARGAMVGRTVLWGVVMAGLLLVAEGALMHLVALSRLRKLRDAARSIVTGAEAPAAPRRDEIGELAADLQRFSSALQDTQAEVGRQRQFLVDLIDQVEDGVAVFDRSLHVVAANQSYLQRTGADRERMARGELRCSEVPFCGSAEAHEECPARAAFRSGRLQKRIHATRSGDRELYMEVFASPILGKGGEVEHVVEVWRDVTERLALQANLARSEQLAAVGTLASGFSHEISTPLGTMATSIQGMLRALKGKQALGAEEVAALASRLEVAAREVFRCRDITRSLLDLGRRRRTVRGPLDVGEAVERMLQAVAPSAREAGVSLAHRAGRPCSVPAHADQIDQVLLNLLMNALEAMPDGGALQVETAACEGGVEVVVADSGRGIPEADAERIFEPFFTRKSGGTGLGLYLSRQIVEAHGGRLELSPARGPGARFRMFLPASERAAPGAEPAAKAG